MTDSSASINHYNSESNSSLKELFAITADRKVWVLLMWQNATIFFVVLGILRLVITEVLRSVVDRKRLERNGLGGTQDIAIGGMIVGWICAIAAIICGLGWSIQYLIG